MRILHFSDTHGLHHQIENIPIADVIIHSGDISHNGTEDEVLDFLKLVHRTAISAQNLRDWQSRYVFVGC